jgi:hypothetical protein
VRCARHPDVETNLACGKCGTPICPKCLVQTPVGARCPTCANLRKLPVYEVSTTYYSRAVVAALGGGAALGAAWYFIEHYVPFGGWFLFLIAAGIGYAVGEITSRAVNRKRGRGLQLAAAGGVIASYVVRSVILQPNAGFIDAFVDLWGLLALLIGVVIAVGHFRG